MNPDDVRKITAGSSVHSVRVGNKYWAVIEKEKIDLRMLIEKSLEKIFPGRFK